MNYYLADTMNIIGTSAHKLYYVELSLYNYSARFVWYDAFVLSDITINRE